jgi:hypothetical protein
MKRVVLASALAFTLLMNGIAFAQFTQHAGNIVVYHLNSTVMNRGPCVQTVPPAPTNGWICLYKTDPLYLEIRELLRDANDLGRECIFGWLLTDANGFAILSLLQCF